MKYAVSMGSGGMIQAYMPRFIKFSSGIHKLITDVGDLIRHFYFFDLRKAG